MALIQKDISDEVVGKLDALQQEGLLLPPSYSAQNALKSAFFAMTNAPEGNLIEKCSKASVANALLDMVTQGLSPAKTQCYFVPYGGQLKLTRSYFGTQAVLKRLSNVEDIWANVIYQDDVFEYENSGGREKLLKHETKLENRDKAILGAYAIVKTSNGDEIMTVMTKKEIEVSWGQAKTKNVQNKFPQEMAKRTVINRAAKSFVNTSDDSDLLVQAINNTTENEYENRKEITAEEEVAQEIQENANAEVFEPEIIEPTQQEIFQADPAEQRPPKEESDPF